MPETTNRRDPCRQRETITVIDSWCYRETCSSETGGRCRGDDAEFSGERNALTCLLNLRDASIPQPQLDASRVMSDG
ncbi:hypothetical protein KUCAC02_033172 [Chaenocephalus aceratus]|nr:hypothetical protein KUCAC02_033172 [Chaenocephalus aceratus]